MQNTHIRHILIAFLFLSVNSCSISDSPKQNQAVTPTTTENSPVAHVPIIRPPSTIPAVLTNTPIPTITKTPEYLPLTLNRSLSDAMLTKDDILAFEEEITYYASLQDTFINEKVVIADTTVELISWCPIECTKQTWSTFNRETMGLGGEPIILNKKVIVMLIRSDSEITAKTITKNLYKSFYPLVYEYNGEEIRQINAPTNNTYLGTGIANNRRFVLLTTSRGAITLMILSYPNQFSDDGLYEVDVVTDFANIQLKKLEKLSLAN